MHEVPVFLHLHPNIYSHTNWSIISTPLSWIRNFYVYIFLRPAIYKGYTVYYIDFQNFLNIIVCIHLYISFHEYESTSNDSVKFSIYKS